MKLLIKYGKVGPSRFASHRDYARALERGLRRADVPMAYSSGFNPHQRVSYINPAPTGAESQAEYVVLGLREMVDPQAVGLRLSAAMPSGLPVLAVSVATGHEQFSASLWRVRLAGVTAEGWCEALGGLDAQGWRGAAERLSTRDAAGSLDGRGAEGRLSTRGAVGPLDGRDVVTQVEGRDGAQALVENRDAVGGLVIRDTEAPAEGRDTEAQSDASETTQLLVTRETKNGPRTFDVLAPLESARVTHDGDLILVIRHTEPLVRPDDVVTGLRSISALPSEPARLTRLAQGEVGELVASVSADFTGSHRPDRCGVLACQ
ncbi:MAG: TIGR03936 family radical SAM-associated protein [Propionibacteriaceae bacterium]|jgi:hypothetical protein|nr:TIGR03936 family radical SAM-associated protein [Propionibacteriaceae bacterium]